MVPRLTLRVNVPTVRERPSPSRRATAADTTSFAVTRQSAAQVTLKRTDRLPEPGSVNVGRASGWTAGGGGVAGISGRRRGRVGCRFRRRRGRAPVDRELGHVAERARRSFSRRLTRTNRTPAAPAVGANSFIRWRAAGRQRARRRPASTDRSPSSSTSRRGRSWSRSSESLPHASVGSIANRSTSTARGSVITIAAAVARARRPAGRRALVDGGLRPAAERAERRVAEHRRPSGRATPSCAAAPRCAWSVAFAATVTGAICRS